jgi:hypothetical protein
MKKILGLALAACLLTAGIANSASAALVGFKIGTTSFFGDVVTLGISNTSDPGITLTSLTIDFTGLPGSPLWDTAPSGGPGVVPFQVVSSIGSVSISAGDLATASANADGSPVATLATFTAFAPGDEITLKGDADLFGGGFNVIPTGALVSAVFSNGGTAAALLVANPISIGGTSFDYSGASVVPEPGSLLCFGGLMLGLVARKRRSV